MMTTQHTPEPWVVTITERSVRIRFGPDPGAAEIAWPLYGGEDAAEDAVTVADAYLVGAAPKLRVACERAESLLAELCRHLPTLRRLHCENVLETVRAALATATPPEGT
jgi:hypothetical protein